MEPKTSSATVDASAEHVSPSRVYFLFKLLEDTHPRQHGAVVQP